MWRPRWAPAAMDLSRSGGLTRCRPIRPPDQPAAFIAAVHDAQNRKGLWLSRHPFVQAVRTGSATREELGRWVRQIYCTTRAYASTLLNLSPPPPVGVW